MEVGLGPLGLCSANEKNSKFYEPLADRGRWTFYFLNYYRKYISVALTATELNFDEFKSRGLHEKQAIASWNLETISAFA
jgi:hypothetical protein